VGGELGVGELGVRSEELGVGSGELGVGSGELGVGVGVLLPFFPQLVVVKKAVTSKMTKKDLKIIFLFMESAPCVHIFTMITIYFNIRFVNISQKCLLLILYAI
jgi:hypothetical protein